MHIIKVRNVHKALPSGMMYLINHGINKDSRAGKVIVAPEPVVTQYTDPRERVMFWTDRDANPFFHFFEGLWMLAGRNDVEYLTKYNKRMLEFSDDGQTLHGAYGYRWIEHFSMDQVQTIIGRLKGDPTTRRCVLAMWDPEIDLDPDPKDIPCNTHIYFSMVTDRLDMTVCSRSNDIIWGLYGTNAVHFSMLQEYMAAGIGCPIGQYYHWSNNYHAYTDVMDPLVASMSEALKGSYGLASPYAFNAVPYKMVETFDNWKSDLEAFMYEEGPVAAINPFFVEVAAPMREAHAAYKNKMYDDAIKIMDECKAVDWQMACTQWLERRKEAYIRAQDNGVNYEQPQQ